MKYTIAFVLTNMFKYVKVCGLRIIARKHPYLVLIWLTFFQEISSAKGDAATKSSDHESYNAFPRFKSTWDISKGSSVSTSPIKPVELSPEAALVEFISTSASFYNVKRQDMKNLELDILKVLIFV